MSKICFAWELGQGFGHLVRYVTLVQRLVDRGDEVHFLVNDAARANEVFAATTVQVEQMERGHTPAEKAIEQPNSYADILFNFGFADPDTLERQLQPWHQRFKTLKPDVLVVDFGPTPMLANRICNIPMISSGSGFTVPPRTTPMKPLNYWSMRHREQLPVNEQAVLQTINVVLSRAGIGPLRQFSDLLIADCEWLLTYAELDHYGGRDGGRYLGSLSAPGFGEPPSWTEQKGSKLFAYLVSQTISDAFLEAVSKLDINLCLYAPNLNPGELDSLSTQRISRADRPVNLDLAAAECSAAVTNGGLNTVSGFLRKGVPQLALPNNLERYMVARRLELAGGGLAVGPVDTGNLATNLRAVLNDRSFARGAERFAARHRGDSVEIQARAMLADIDGLLGR